MDKQALSEADRARIGPSGCERFDALLAWMHDGLRTLGDKPEETPQTALRALWLLAAGTPFSAQAAAQRPLCALSPEQFKKLEQLLAQRLGGTPLAHLTERQQFMGVELLAGPEALIPRHETEALGHAASALLAGAFQTRAEALALDVCTGSGNLALGIALAVPQAHMGAADLSEEAVELARRNVQHHGLGSRVEVRQGDLLAPFDEPAFVGQVDVLICNPPYISSGKVSLMPDEISRFEPQLAFDGGPFGIRILNRLIQEAPRFLRAGGWLAFEVGAGQGDSVRRRLASNAHYSETRTLADSQGQVRAILAQRSG
jgi:release factor glutamine methyltransferase